jgi:predicted nuclease of predicted toxin-antitoxin system
MTRLYADEQFPVAVVYLLRRLGHDVITVRETSVSKTGDATPDELVLEYAASQNRVLMTLNETDFRRLHGLNARHSGILCCPDPSAASAKKVARQIDKFLKRNDMNSRFDRLPPI